ncbi:hypothetical protein TNCT_113651 [Trichonephila clavata]|uniref:Uncharacterized protein n=1 Tax=Trichonephila clavata TaxID=2740835 RepID=A0A8X6H5A1_TRICU|nr:hypothetical protein TNCT_113651 [Trichonephila clavata]
MNLTLKYLFIAATILSMISISLATEEHSKGYLVPKLFQLLSKGEELVESLKRTKRDVKTQGRSQRFCEMFGCEKCNVPEEKKCCAGFSYDPRSKKCREVITS